MSAKGCKREKRWLFSLVFARYNKLDQDSKVEDVNQNEHVYTTGITRRFDWRLHNAFFVDYPLRGQSLSEIRAVDLFWQYLLLLHHLGHRWLWWMNRQYLNVKRVTCRRLRCPSKAWSSSKPACNNFNALMNLIEFKEYVVFSLIFIVSGLTVISAAMNLLVLRFLTLNTIDEKRDQREQKLAKRGFVSFFL